MNENKDTEKKEIHSTNESTTNNNEIHLHLFLMRIDMFTINWMFHFTRNSPRNCYKFYYRLIANVGLENWEKLDKTIKGPWEEARKDFDKLYGLVKAWSYSEKNVEKAIKDQIENADNKAEEDKQNKESTEEINKDSIEEALKKYKELDTEFDWQTADEEIRIMKLQEDWLNAKIKLISKLKQLEKTKDTKEPN